MPALPRSELPIHGAVRTASEYVTAAGRGAPLRSWVADLLPYRPPSSSAPVLCGTPGDPVDLASSAAAGAYPATPAMRAMSCHPAPHAEWWLPRVAVITARPVHRICVPGRGESAVGAVPAPACPDRQAPPARLPPPPAPDCHNGIPAQIGWYPPWLPPVPGGASGTGTCAAQRRPESYGSHATVNLYSPA